MLPHYRRECSQRRGQSTALPDTAARSQGEMRWQPASSLELRFTGFQWQQSRVVRGVTHIIASLPYRLSLKHARIYIYIDLCMLEGESVNDYIYIYTHIILYIHTHIYIYIYIYTHTQYIYISNKYKISSFK